MTTLILLLIFYLESDGPFHFETILDAESYELFESFNLTILEFDSHLYVLNTANQTILKFTDSGSLEAKYHTEEGMGPKAFGKTRCLFSLGDRVVYVNNLNNQAVFLDKNLAFIDGRKLNSGAFAAVNQESHIWLRPRNGETLLALYDSGLKQTGGWFQSPKKRITPSSEVVFLIKNGVVRATRFLYSETPYQLAYYTTAGEVEPGAPLWQNGASMPEEITGPDRGAPKTLFNAIGSIHRVSKSGSYLVIQSELDIEKPPVRTNVFDFYALKDGAFLGRHVADFGMIQCSGNNAYFLKDDRLVKLVKVAL